MGVGRDLHHAGVAPYAGARIETPRDHPQLLQAPGPHAAEHARGFEFHPDQVLEDQPDGSLIVRFRAAGGTEMAWHLYQWGGTVEVIAPNELREMVEGYRPSDFYLVLP